MESSEDEVLYFRIFDAVLSVVEDVLDKINGICKN